MIGRSRVIARETTRIASTTARVVVTLLVLGLPPARADVTVDTVADVDADDAACSLREAIIAVNTDASYHGCVRTPATVDTIAFDLGPGTPGIAVTGSDLPIFTGPVTVDGATGGATRVEVSGGGSRTRGLSFLGATDATGSVIRNMVVNGFTSAQLLVSNGSGFVIEGNLLGLDPTGTALENPGSRGIEICNGIACGVSQGHRIGGPTAAQRNVIAATASAISVGDGSSGNVIEGNFIGTDATGTVALGGTAVTAISINNAANTRVGGTDPGAGNLIVGFNGIVVGGNPALARSSGTVIQGNLIGTDASGSTDLGGGGDGIVVAHAVDTLIGGLVPGAGNLISGHADGISGGSSGVSGTTVSATTIQGNLIGTDATGTASIGNSGLGVGLGGGGPATDGAVIEENVIAFNGQDGVQVNCSACIVRIAGNSIHSNGALAIDLNSGSNGVTANDPDDLDAGPNGRQNFPLLDPSAFAGGTSIAGTLDSTPDTTFRIEVFANDACDASGNGEAKLLVGARDDVATDADGDASFTVTLDQAVAPGTVLTATAIAPDGSTSELSPCTAPAPTTTSTSTTSSTTSTSTTTTTSTTTSTTSTSSTTATTSSTTSSTTATTTSTTTTTGATTTSTTTPGAACAAVPDGPTFASVRCRLAALIGDTEAETALGHLREKLGVPLRKASDRADVAAAVCAADQQSLARGRLRQVVRQLIQYAHRLRSRPTRRRLPADVREPLALAADAIRLDAKALERALRCPEDAAG